VLALIFGMAAVLPLAGCEPPAPGASFEPDSIPDAYAHPSAALLWPGATRTMLVTAEGHVYNGAWQVRLDPAVEGASVPPPQRIAFEDRWLPVAHWTRRLGEIRWDFEAAALPTAEARNGLTGSTGAPDFAASLEVRVRNLGAVARNVRLESRFEAPDARQPFTAPDARGDETHVFGWDPGAVDTVLGFSDASRTGRQVVASWRLGPGESRRIRFVLPAYPAPRSELARWSEVPHARRMQEARAFWRAEVARGARFEIPEPELVNAINAARVALLGMREKHDSRWLMPGDAFGGRGTWRSGGARALQALALHGYVREARLMTEAFSDWQWPQGPFGVPNGGPEGTGLVLWTLEQVMLRPAPSPEVTRYAESARRAWAWCEGTRTAGHARFFGMMPAMNDPDEMPVRPLSADLWNIAGYRATTRLLHAAGHHAAAESVEASRRRYSTDLAAALDSTGSDEVPATWQGPGVEGSQLSAAWPCAALPAGDARLVRTVERHWKQAGDAGLGWSGSPDTLDARSAADLGMWALLAGRRDDADRVLQSLEHWRSASGASAARFTRSGDYGAALPPDPAAAAALLTLARNMAACSDGDTLMLTMGARDGWWRGSRVRGLPTRWGTIDVRFRHKDGVVEWDWTPVPVWTRLTLPRGVYVSPPLPQNVSPRDESSILVPPKVGSARIRVSTETFTR